MARSLGFLLCLGGIALLAWTVVSYLIGGTWDPLLTGAAWANVHASSLQVAQPAVERYLSPFIWQSIIGPILITGLWLVMIVVGFLMMLPALLRAR